MCPLIATQSQPKARQRSAISVSPCSIGQAEASHVDGTWMIRDLVLNFDCQRAVCGRIVWIGDAARRPAQCGQTIVWGLEAQSPLKILKRVDVRKLTGRC
jgi:hypothetical protein